MRMIPTLVLVKMLKAKTKLIQIQPGKYMISNAIWLASSLAA